MSPKTILIIEFNDVHGEILPSYIKYFLDLGYKVDILTVCKQKICKSLYIFYTGNGYILDNKLLNNRMIILKSFSKETDKIFVNPHYFGSISITSKNDNITKFISIGQLEDKRRNTNLLINSAKYLIKAGYDNFKLTIISRLGKPPYELFNLDKYIIYKENLDYINMYKEIEEADFILPMLDPKNIEHEIYIKK